MRASKAGPGHAPREMFPPARLDPNPCLFQPANHSPALAGEAGDLVYHTLVLLAERGLTAADVLGVLRSRHTA